MSVVDALRRNDPATTTRLTIRLRDEPSDADLAQALEQNPFTTDIDLYLEGEQRADDWNSLLRVIAMRANLETVKVEDAYDAEDRNAPAALVSAILRAIQQNSAVHSVLLINLYLPTDVSTFLDTASSITIFGLHGCDMEPIERVQGARDIAAALQRNTNIKTLRLGKMGEDWLSSILQGLQSNNCLKTLLIFQTESLSDATTRAIQQLLESTASIQSLWLCGISFENNGDTLRTVAQSLIRSPIVCRLKFFHCQFEDEESAALFQSILQNKQNLSYLALDHCSFSAGRIHEDIISVLLRPSSSLRSLEVQELSLGTTRLPNSQFQNLLRAVEKSKLERFTIGRIQSPEQLRTLTDSIPLMRVKELQVVMASDFDVEDAKPLLLQAIKNNFSLLSVKGKRVREELFDANDKTRLVFYAGRNERLDQWVENPETSEQKLWPEALKLAEKAGPDSLFRGLRSVLGGDSAGLRAVGRKRKRPQYYAPS